MKEWKEKNKGEWKGMKKWRENKKRWKKWSGQQEGTKEMRQKIVKDEKKKENEKGWNKWSGKQKEMKK